jgi:hypothetical protein
VKSFVGAIALGWIFAQGILNFATIFSAPIAGFLGRREYRSVVPNDIGSIGFSFQEAIPALIRSFVLLFVGYFLLRWLYFKPAEELKDRQVSSAG